MNIVAEMSLYPLKDGPIPTIIGFIREMQEQDGIEIVTNQLSSQVSGSFAAVTSTVNRCMEKVMAEQAMAAAPDSAQAEAQLSMIAQAKSDQIAMIRGAAARNPDRTIA